MTTFVTTIINQRNRWKCILPIYSQFHDILKFKLIHAPPQLLLPLLFILLHFHSLPFSYSSAAEPSSPPAPFQLEPTTSSCSHAATPSWLTSGAMPYHYAGIRPDTNTSNPSYKTKTKLYYNPNWQTVYSLSLIALRFPFLVHQKQVYRCGNEPAVL